MTKRANRYHLILKQVESAKESFTFPEPISIEFENHDEIFRIIKILCEKNHFGDVKQSTEFAIGLKMFSEIVLKNRNHHFLRISFQHWKFYENTKKLIGQLSPRLSLRYCKAKQSWKYFYATT